MECLHGVFEQKWHEEVATSVCCFLFVALSSVAAGLAAQRADGKFALAEEAAICRTLSGLGWPSAEGGARAIRLAGKK